MLVCLRIIAATALAIIFDQSVYLVKQHGELLLELLGGGGGDSFSVVNFLDSFFMVKFNCINKKACLAN